MDPTERVDLTLDDDEDGEAENRLLQTAQASSRPHALHPHKEGTPIDTIEEDTPLGLGPPVRVPERACQPCESGSMSEEIRNLLADTGQPSIRQHQQPRPALSNSITDALKALLGGSSGLDRIKEDEEVVQPSGINRSLKLDPSAEPSVRPGVGTGLLASKAVAKGSRATFPSTDPHGAAAPSMGSLPAPTASTSVLPHHSRINDEVLVIDSDSDDKDLFEDFDWLSKLGSKGQQQRETAQVCGGGWMWVVVVLVFIVSYGASDCL